jgi:hypothetical protein
MAALLKVTRKEMRGRIFLSEKFRVARFFVVRHTKTGKTYIPKVTTKYTKGP